MNLVGMKCAARDRCRKGGTIREGESTMQKNDAFYHVECFDAERGDVGPPLTNRPARAAVTPAG